MRWYSGGIQEAVMASKAKGAVFVVYIEGIDDKSKTFTGLIENEEVSSKLGSDNFVAIKLEADSVSHRQFSELYNSTTVPSLYFIGKNGKPLKIVTEITDASSLSKELDGILEGNGPSSAATSSQNFLKSESAMLPNVVCENGVCTIKKEAPSSSTEVCSPPEGDAPMLSSEEKVERAKKLLEQKRSQREREDEEAEKLKEIERRKMGQEVQKMKKWQDDQEMKQALEDREKERKREKEAKDRVLAQIAQDKLDRAAKFAPVASSTPTQQATAGPSVPRPTRQESNTARLQFKMADGTSKTQDFPSTDKLQSVLNYIQANLNLPYSKFTLSTTFPRRQFTETDYTQTLAELELTPNAVILILPIGGSGTVSTNALPGGITGFIWALFAPLIQLLSAIKSWFTGEQGGTSGGYSSGAGGASSSQRKSSNSVIQIRSKYDLENRIQSAGTKLIVIDFFATWCGPCKMIAPELENMAKDYPHVLFLKVDVDQNGDISQSYGVQSMPTFVILKNKREVTRFSGADSYQLRNTIQRYK